MTTEIILSVVLVVVSIVAFLCILAQSAEISSLKEERSCAIDNENNLHAEIRRYSEALRTERVEREPTRRGEEENNPMYAIRDNLTAPHHYMGVTSEGEAVLSDGVAYSDEFIRGAQISGFSSTASVGSVSGNTTRERNQWTGQDR